MSPHRVVRHGIDHLAVRVGSRTVAWLIVFVSALTIGAILVTIGGYFALKDQQTKNTKTASQLHTAVCALQVEEVKRIASSRAFLRQHPDGWLGITPAQIRVSIHQYQTTLEALSAVECDA